MGLSTRRPEKRLETPVPASGILRATRARVGADRLELLELLGRGGMSEVHRGLVHGPRGFRRRVAVKRLLPWLVERDPSMTHVLATEARMLARLNHPAIVTLLGFGSFEGELTLLIELIDGASLAMASKLLTAHGEPLSHGASLFISYRLFDALSAIHAAVDPESGKSAPILHCDVSPGNLLLPWDGYAKLADFGLSVLAGAQAEARAKIMKGTHRYMAPEQIGGGRVSAASDVYSACVIARELLTRTRVDLAPLRIRALRPDLPRRLCDLLDAGLEPRPHARRVTAREIADAVAAVMPMDQARRELAIALRTVRRVAKEARNEDSTSVTMRGEMFESETSTPKG